MSIPGNANPLLLRSAGTASAGISRSLRFNSSDSAYLSRTPASAGDRRKFTFAAWVKIASLTAGQNVLFSVTDGTTPFAISWQSDGALVFGNLSFAWKETTAKLRDYSAWYHICVSVDTDQASNANRLKFYVNGAQQTDFSTNRDLYLNTNIAVNGAFTHEIGRYSAGSNQYFNGLLADVFFIDGQQLTPSSFTETDATTGQLIPKAYTGSYGTNGFRLEFADNSSNTATTLGKDTSGNGNNWTPNNLSVTAGAGNDSLVDVPTNGAQTDTGVGGEVRGNYCTLNPLDIVAGNGVAATNGNLDATLANSSINGTIAIPGTGKWYFESTVTRLYSSTFAGFHGITKQSTTSWSGVYSTTGSDTPGIYKNGSRVQTVAGIAVGDVFGVAVNMDALSLQIYKNGSTFGSAVTIDSATYLPYFGGNGNNTSDGSQLTANFGQRPFAYTAPSGFKALCTANLPAPLVTKPSTVFDVLRYVGNGTSQTISGLNFSPDFVWGKNRSSAFYHILVDSIRGATARLFSNTTDAESVFANSFTAFTSNGFSVGSASDVNNNNDAIVAWCWDAGSSTVTNNTAGTITPTGVRANATAGFSVVTYTGTGANATVGHGLGIAPQLMIVKRRSTVDDWAVYHSAIGATKFLYLNLTNAADTASTRWQDTAPTSTVFSIGTSGQVNGSGSTYVAYCFAPVVGYSSFGSYTGNGSSDGPFVYTGFRPKWLLIKQSSVGGENWILLDSVRNTYNVLGEYLAPDSSAAGSTTGLADFLSNGFKLRVNTGAATNASGATYIYAAFAESPFNYARAR